jgi:hypothetical protein
MGKDRPDLHALFEAAGNEPVEREGVLGAIDELTRAGMLDACGSDFYMLTERGLEIPAKQERRSSPNKDKVSLLPCLPRKTCACWLPPRAAQKS